MRTQFLILLLAVGLPFLSQAQPPSEPDGEVNAETRAAVIERLTQELTERYIFPAKAAEAAALLRKKAGAKAYDSLSSARAFAETLTADLQAVTRDKHLRVRYSHEPLPPAEGGRRPPSPAQEEDFRRDLARKNFEFRRVEILPGNIGYLDLHGFVPPQFAEATAAASFNFLAETDALIIDLRQNGGGAPRGVALVCSYLFGPEPVHLNDLIRREGEKEVRQEYWTLPEVAGKRYLKRPVYLLTSAKTFSGGEEFAYNIKTQRRGTLIGETTGGGANPGGMSRLSDHFRVFIPDGRAENPVTKDNWEGKGVAPDVAVPAADALGRAQLLALRKLLEEAGDDSRRATELKQAIAALEKSAPAPPAGE